MIGRAKQTNGKDQGFRRFGPGDPKDTGQLNLGLLQRCARRGVRRQATLCQTNRQRETPCSEALGVHSASCKTTMRTSTPNSDHKNSLHDMLFVYLSFVPRVGRPGQLLLIGNAVNSTLCALRLSKGWAR